MKLQHSVGSRSLHTVDDKFEPVNEHKEYQIPESQKESVKQQGHLKRMYTISKTVCFVFLETREPQGHTICIKATALRKQPQLEIKFFEGGKKIISYVLALCCYYVESNPIKTCYLHIFSYSTNSVVQISKHRKEKGSKYIYPVIRKTNKRSGRRDQDPEHPITRADSVLFRNLLIYNTVQKF